MKKLILFVSALSLLTLGSCSEDDSNNITSTAYLYDKAASNLPVTESESFVDIDVLVTTKSNSDRTFTVTADPTSTATPAMYTVSGNLVIPAGSYRGTFRVTGNFDALPAEQLLSIKLNLQADGYVMESKSVHTITIFKVCPSDLAGTYTTSATGTNGLNGAGYNINSSVTLTATATPGVYLISDMSFGMYAGVYNDAAPSGRVEDICNNLTGLGDVDQYNDPFTITGSVNSTTGVITLTWSNTYGDNGTVTLTPQ